MDQLPEIGQRVRYHSVSEFWDRECTGTVRKIYEGLDENGYVPFDPECWSAAVEVDKPLPAWWAYGDVNRFAPSISELSPA